MLSASIFISTPGFASLSRVAEENIASFRTHHPNLQPRMFDLDDILDLVRDQFPREVLHALRSLKPFAYQADLGRYCILYAFGGAYADLSYFFVDPIPVEEAKATVFRDLTFSSPWDASNGVILAPAGHKALQRAIEMVCANVARGYYGSTCLCPTGPALFGKALATTCEAEDLITGSAVRMRRERLQPRVPDLALPEGEDIHCLAFRRRIFAIKRKPLGAAGLDALGISGGNNYAQLWGKRDVYQAVPAAD
jgi:hypothetical protein